MLGVLSAVPGFALVCSMPLIMSYILFCVLSFVLLVCPGVVYLSLSQSLSLLLLVDIWHLFLWFLVPDSVPCLICFIGVVLFLVGLPRRPFNPTLACSMSFIMLCIFLHIPCWSYHDLSCLWPCVCSVWCLVPLVPSPSDLRAHRACFEGVLLCPACHVCLTFLSPP